MHWLKTQREAMGLERHQLAKKAGVYRTTIWNIESGKSQPNYKTLLKLAEAGIKVPGIKEKKKRKPPKSQCQMIELSYAELSALAMTGITKRAEIKW